MGHIVFRGHVTSVCAYVHMSLFNQSLTNVYMQVYLHVYIHIYVQVAHNFDTLYATKLKFGMIFTHTKTLDFRVELPLGLAPGWDLRSKCIAGHIEHMQNGNRIMSGTITCPRKLEIKYSDHR